MRKAIFYFSFSLLVLLLACCGRKENKQLSGIWKLETFNINGTDLDATSLGNWLWEFNDEGGYLVNMEGAQEKGTYTYKDSTLTLTPVTNAQRPAQVYQVTRLDSATLYLYSATEKNTTQLQFIKIDASEVGEND